MSPAVQALLDSANITAKVSCLVNGKYMNLLCDSGATLPLVSETAADLGLQPVGKESKSRVNATVEPVGELDLKPQWQAEEVFVHIGDVERSVPFWVMRDTQMKDSPLRRYLLPAEDARGT
jgi:hypothetical protein